MEHLTAFFPAQAFLAPHTSAIPTRCIDDYRVEVEAVVDTGEAVLLVRPFSGTLFQAPTWGVPKGTVGLNELPEQAALRIARESTNLLVEVTHPAILGTRIVTTQHDGRCIYRLVYTYALGVLRDAHGDMLTRFKLGDTYLWHQWLPHESQDILGMQYDTLDTDLRAIIARFIGAPTAC